MGKKYRTYATLVAAIIEQNGSAYWLAKASGVSQVTLSDLANGRRRNPTAETLRKILFAAHLTWGWLDDVFDPLPTEGTPKPKTRGGRK